METITFEQLPKAVTQLSNEISEIKRLLLSRSESQPQADQLLSVQQAAEFLNLSVPTIYGLVSKSELPVNKRGKRLYFSKQELTDWIKAGRKKTQAEIEAESANWRNPQKKRR